MTIQTMAHHAQNCKTQIGKWKKKNMQTDFFFFNS